MRNPAEFLRSRASLVGLSAVLGLGVHGATPRPPERTVAGLALMLGAAAHGVASPRDVAWEPSPGWFEETFWGRRVLFLAAPAVGKPRDLYRAVVRLGFDGAPVAVTRLRNLTETPIGDDTALHVVASTAVFATVAYGHIQGISTLELGGLREEDRPKSLFDRLLLAVTEYQETGSFAGIGRTDIVLDVPAKTARLTLAPPLLEVDLGAEGRRVTYDLPSREAKGDEGAQAYGAHAVPQQHPPKPAVLWAVDTVRAEVGPGPIAWLEDKVFGAKDALHRTTYSMLSSSKEIALKENGADVVAAVSAPATLDASKLDDGESSWPPPTIPSLWKETKPGEGEWQPVTLPWLKPLPAKTEGTSPPAYFYRTTIRPDSKRPYAVLLLIAMDMRQLELGMEAGFEDPKPLTGPPGAGRLPRDPELTGRIVATFNGAFKTTHGKYGMMVDRRVLLPPVPGAASVVVEDDGDVGLGNWPSTDAIPAELSAFRQNLDPLVEDGVANPTGRNIWGWQLNGTSVMTERTAICVTPAGHLYFAWGNEIDGPTLGHALRQAGCSYGIHLDMNPHHCGFVFTDVIDLQAKQFNLKRADDEMEINSDKFVRWSPKDFFYVMVRDPTPHDPSGVRWKPDAGAQPPPNWLPAVFTGQLALGGLSVTLLDVERGRVAWKVRAGTLEPTALDAAPKVLELSGDDRFRAILALGLGHATESQKLGLAFGARPSLPLGSNHATLVLRADGNLELYGAGSPPTLGDGDEAAQLPLLAEDGKLTPHALEHGPMRTRGALCVTPTGRVILGMARHDSSDPIAAALLRVGCKRVVELDRGSHHPAFAHRVGTPTPPLASYETSVLYALGRPMQPHARRWKPAGSAASNAPTLYDYPLKPKAAAAPSRAAPASSE